jgi:RHS repeat-associated protein
VKRQLSKLNGTWGTTYQTTRSYNLAGGVTSQTYPSGHTVSYSYDAAGRESSFSGNLGDGATRTYSTSIDYDAFGGLRQEQFGTQVPLYLKKHYNRRGQLFDIRLSTTSWTTDQWNWNRGALVNYYSSNYAWEGDPSTPAGPDNNGNVLLQQHWVPGDDAISTFNYTQDYFAYDSLNRIQSAAEYHGTQASQSPQDYAQVFAYDRWGNRTINPSSWGTGVNLKQFTVDAATNRLGVPVGQSGAMSYDNAGNLITDTYTGVGSRTYDAENRMTTAADNTGQVSRYSYDADGHRVRRQVGLSQEEWQIYGIDGELIAEYPANGSTASPQKEYGYRNGQLLVTAEPANNLHWLVSDHLGTPRMIVDATGALANVKRHDYLPFGEELFAGTGGRTTAQGYSGGDGIRQQFTQKERDVETGLDYFLARYYSSTQGRFTSVDPQNIIFDKNRGRNGDERARILQSYIVQPQNWNRYTYTRNNPLAYTDPNGRCSAPSGLSKGNVGICIEAFIASPRINTIGRGDNRDFAANDPSKTSRLEVSGTISRSASGDWNTHLTATAGTSHLLVGPGLAGTATLSVTQNVDKEGNLHVQVKTTGDNGFSGLPGAPAGQIQINVNLIVTPDGKVGIESGERTAYPSTGLYVYTMGADGKPAAATLGEGRETTPAALTQSLVPIQAVPPTCNCPKPEDEKKRGPND